MSEALYHLKLALILVEYESAFILAESYLTPESLYHLKLALILVES